MDPDPGKEIEVDPDPAKCSGYGWIRIRILNAGFKCMFRSSFLMQRNFFKSLSIKGWTIFSIFKQTGLVNTVFKKKKKDLYTTISIGKS